MRRPAPKSKPLLCAAWACSDVRAFFWAVLLAEPGGPPALFAAGGVVGVEDGAVARKARCRGPRLRPPAAATPGNVEGLLRQTRPPQVRPRPASLRTKACGGLVPDTATARYTPRIGAAGPTEGKEGAGVAKVLEAVPAAGAAADRPPLPEAAASTPLLLYHSQQVLKSVVCRESSNTSKIVSRILLRNLAEVIGTPWSSLASNVQS